MKLRWLKYFFIFLLLVVLAGGGYVYNYAMSLLAPRPSMLDSPTTFIGFNHIGISVLDLDKMVDFYKEATGYKVVRRYKVENNEVANKLYAQDSMVYERAILKGPNMLLELTEFADQPDSVSIEMPFYGPGMTHTCYQGPIDKPVYDKFKKAGADIISRGEGTVEVSSVRVSYAYAYDPEGNMMELEHMPNILVGMAVGKKWAAQNPMWMTQVALISPDINKLVDYYKDVLEIEPYRVNTYGPHPLIDEVVDHDSVRFEGAWFGMDTQGKKLEMMQYTEPVTQQRPKPMRLTDLGYSFSFEVEDINKEYIRLKEKGVAFVSEPGRMDDFWMVYAHDPDGNIFSLRQIVDPNSALSLKNM